MNFIYIFFIIIVQKTVFMSGVVQQETKGPCAICGESIPHILGQTIIHYCRCGCDENPLICPICRRDKKYPCEPKVCRWCHQRIYTVLSCIRSNARQIELPTIQWLFVNKYLLHLNQGFRNFLVFTSFRKRQTHFFSILGDSRCWILSKRYMPYRHLRHFSVRLARMLICNMFGELKTTDFFAGKRTIVKQNNELMRMVFQRVLSVLEFILFDALKSRKWW
jgi:hypothetical protein